MDIKPIFEGKILNDIPKGPQGQPEHKAGSPFALANAVDSKKLQKFIMVTPNPVCFYLRISEKAVDEHYLLIEKLDKSTKMTIFPINTDKEEKFRGFNSEELYNLFENSFYIPIFLYTSLEAFSNQVIPSNYIYSKFLKGTLINMNKGDIERKISLEEKLDRILNDICQVNLKKHSVLWEDFKAVKNIRDELIHLKTREQSSEVAYNHLYARLIDSDYKRWFDSFIKIIKLYKPDYFS